MPKRILPLLGLLLALNASADSVRRLEIFIDTDPGVGNGSTVLITAAQQADTVNSSFSFTLPANIRPGRHRLYVRALADTAGAAPRWSLVQARDFYVPEQVVAAEYFIDSDPGTGSGTPISITTPADTVNLTASIPTTGAGPGKHVLYVRTRTNAGRWGLVQRREFHVLPAVTAAEYFIDTDPGIGNGLALAVTTPADTVNGSWNIATPAGLSAGRHRLYVRTRSGSAWGLSQVRDFEVLPAITAAEYFFDTDPGVGMGTALNVGTPSDTVQFSSSITTAGLGSGPHKLYVRSRSANGRWGLSATRDLYVVPRIVAAEYFWDTDPGVGAGIAITVPAPGDTVNLNPVIKAPCLAPGAHHLYIRTKDEAGRWALSHEDTVSFQNPAIVANLSFPGPGPYGTPVKVTGSGGTGPYSYTYNAGTPTADNIFLPPNGASAVFTATDSCGYSATASLTTPASPTMIAGGTGGSGSVSLEAYRHWAWVLNASGHIIAAVKDNGQPLGMVSVDYLKNNSGTVRQFPNSSIRYLDRNWLINSGIPPVSAVGLQLFAVDSEFNALAAVDPTLSSKNALRVQKYDGPNEDLSPANNSGAGATVLQYTPDSVVSFSGPAANGNGYALAFSVSGFSEFYESRAAAVPLANAPLELALRRSTEGVELYWNARDLQGLQRQELDRGGTAAGFELLANVPLNGAAHYLDRQPLSGMNHYRLRAVSQDGKELYSNTVSIRIVGERSIAVYPNPARGVLHIDGLRGEDALSLYDVAGRKVYESAGSQRIDLRGLTGGLYLLRMQLANGETIQQRVEVVK